VRIALVILFVVALAMSAQTAEATPGGSLILSAPAIVPIQTPFAVTVEGESPDAGYVAVQTKLTYPAVGGLSYAPSPGPADEALWPDCVTAARLAQPGSVLWACVAGPPYTGPTNYSGPIAAFAFSCPQPAVVPFALVPRVGDLQLGSHYVDATTDPIDPALAGASVTCAVDYDADGCEDLEELADGRDHLNALDWPDVNGDGAIGAADLAAVVAGFGTPSPDVTGDGIVSAADLTAVVSQFGQVC